MNETERIQAQHRLEEAQARDRVKKRKARTRRLIQIGAIAESVFPKIKDMELEDAKSYMEQMRDRYEIGIGGSSRPRLLLLFFFRRAHLLTTCPQGKRWYPPSSGRALLPKALLSPERQTMPQAVIG